MRKFKAKVGHLGRTQNGQPLIENDGTKCKSSQTFYHLFLCLCLNRPLVVRWSEALPKRQRMNLHRNKLSPMELSRSSRRTWIVSNHNVVQLQHSHRRRQENSTYNDWSALPAASLRQASGWRNFSEWRIIGPNSVCMSNIKDHAQSDQHMHALMLLKKEQGRAAGLGVSPYTPIQFIVSLYCCISCVF